MKAKEAGVGSVQKCLRDGTSETNCVGDHDSLMRTIPWISRVFCVNQRYHKRRQEGRTSIVEVKNLSGKVKRRSEW